MGNDSWNTVRTVTWLRGATWNQLLVKLIVVELFRSSGYPGVGTGWNGAPTFFDLPEARELTLFLRSCLPPCAWELVGQPHIMHCGDVVPPHRHQGTVNAAHSNEWAGIYYPAAVKRGGELYFHGVVGRMIQPEESMAIIFPAEMMLEIRAHRSLVARPLITFTAHRSKQSEK